MIFTFSLFLILTSEFIFVNSLTVNQVFLVPLIGYTHLLIFLGALIALFLIFRNRKKKTDFKIGFTIFGTFVVCFVPSLAYMIPGIAYLLTDHSFFQSIGWVLAICLQIGLIVGIYFGRWNWTVHRIELEFLHLPEDFHEIKIVQISDIHLGSFYKNYEKVKKGISKINELNPDYVFFTGDLVNNTVDEIYGWENIFLDINAKKGKFSILGNHDYGDYVKWENEAEKVSNLNKLIESHRTIGFIPLLNESIQLTEGFWLIGVENWGKAPFRQSGRLDEALSNVPKDHFKLLLSHDPSHFDEQVVNTNIDLTLSGHTHGMQFGIERFGIKWSPVSWKYKKWAGLYKVGKQYLYVNRGFGYIGFPGRVGIYPEITEIILKIVNYSGGNKRSS